MIVDCHTHIKSLSDSLAVADFLEVVEKVDACFLLADPCDQGADSKQLTEQVRQNSKLIGFASVNPLEDKLTDKAITSAISGAGFHGAVLYCSQKGFHPTHSRAMRFYTIAAELGIPVFFHNSPPFTSEAVLDYAQPYLIDEVARTFPTLKIIIGSMGQPFVDQTLCMLCKHPNVYADLTIDPTKIWQVYNIVINAYEADVMDKLLFGSGYPFAEAGSCIETLLGFNKLLADTNLPGVPREKIRAIIERDTLSLFDIAAK